MSKLVLHKVTEKTANKPNSKLDIIALKAEEGEKMEYYRVQKSKKAKKVAANPDAPEKMSGKNLRADYFKGKGGKAGKAKADKPKKKTKKASHNPIF